MAGSGRGITGCAPSLHSRLIFGCLFPTCPAVVIPTSPPEPYDAASLAAIISDGLDTLFAADNTAFDLMGFSFGGTLSGMVAHAQADRIRSLTIVGTPPRCWG